MNSSMTDQLAVVPIVVNAGAAVLPAILAGIVSVVAVVFRPREWGRVAREKPYVPVVILAVAAVIGGVMWAMPAASATPAGSLCRRSSHCASVHPAGR